MLIFKDATYSSVLSGLGVENFQQDFSPFLC